MLKDMGDLSTFANVFMKKALWRRNDAILFMAGLNPMQSIIDGGKVTQMIRHYGGNCFIASDEANSRLFAVNMMLRLLDELGPDATKTPAEWLEWAKSVGIKPDLGGFTQKLDSVQINAEPKSGNLLKQKALLDTLAPYLKDQNRVRGIFKNLKAYPDLRKLRGNGGWPLSEVVRWLFSKGHFNPQAIKHITDPAIQAALSSM